jgi:tetratricopeptide (TPR) repeat protein
MMHAEQTIGPYRVLDRLGRGGMGLVYRARHVETGQMVALKSVAVRKTELLRSIEREIHALARIRHPGVVRILDEGLHLQAPWFAMELIDGVPLPQHCASLDRPHSLGVVRRLCSALAHVHGEGLVHGDLKPDNVLVRRDGSPVLVDFGLASRFWGEVSREALLLEGLRSGTVTAMAPEQILGEPLDARTDLYALGCVLYELVTGRPPFVGAVAAQVVRAHMKAAPTPPSELAEGVPPRLDALILGLLGKRPRDRPGHADDVAAELDAVGALGDPDAGPGRARPYLYRPALVGRDAPLAQLTERLSRLRDAGGGLVLLGGESGVGKTRLAMELARQAVRRQIAVLAGDGSAPAGLDAGQAETGPLQPLRGALGAIGERCRAGGPETTARLLGTRAAILADYAPELVELVEPGQRPAEDLQPGEAQARFFGALAESFAALGRESAALVILDDLHWADELTLGFLKYVAGRGTAAPVLFLGTYRTEEAREPGRPILRALLEAPEALRIELGRLDADAVSAIISDMLADARPPEAVVRALTGHSEGNPFFVAEYLRTALAAGRLDRDQAGRWQVVGKGPPDTPLAACEALPLPDSVREIVARRIEGLGRDARALAEAAAVLGREPAPSVLHAVCGLSPVAILEATHELLLRQVLEEPSPARLRFVHDKIREVAYERIPTERRRALHRDVAEALEARPEIDSGQRLSALGHHWERAGAPDRARGYHLGGARQARSRHALAEAESLYRAYLRPAGPPGPESVAARNELAHDVLRVQGRVSEALSEHRTALAEARALGDRRASGHTLRLLGICCRQTGQVEHARSLFAEALELARESGDRAAEARTLGSLAILDADQGRPDTARALYQQALDLVGGLGDRRAEARILGDLANLLSNQGRTQQALGLYERVLGLARELVDPRMEGNVLGNLALQHATQGRLEQARRLYEQALEVHRANGNRRAEAMALGNLAVLEIEQGRLSQSRVRLEQVVAISREAGDPRNEGIALGNLAWIHAQQGRAGQARELLDQALARARQLGEPRFEAVTLTSRAAVERRAGELAQAGSALDTAESSLRRLGAALELGLCLCERGHLALAAGDPGVAERCHAEAQELAAALQVRPESRLVRAVARLSRGLRAHSAGARLLHGECIGDLPEGVRQALEGVRG